MINSVLKGIGGGFGRALGRILAFIFIGFIVFLFLQKNDVNIVDYINPLKWIGFDVSAASVTPYQYLQSCTSGRYNIIKADENETITFAQVNNSYNIPWKAILFTGSATLSANTYYDLTINFMSNPTNFGFTANSTSVGSISSICGTEQDSYSVSSLNITSSKVVVRFLTGSTSRSYFYINLTSENMPTMSNGISSVTINSVDLTGSSGIINNNNENTNNIINNNNQNTDDIIDNQTQNTQDIIDNQNQNTQDTIDNQNQNNNSNTIVASEFESNYNCGNNLISMTEYHLINNNTWRYISSGSDFVRLNASSVGSTSTFPLGYSFNVTKDKFYYISFDTTNDNNNFYQIYLYKNGWSNTVFKFFDKNTNNIYFTADYTGTMYLQLYMLSNNKASSNFYLRNLRIRQCTNKLDDLSDSQSQTNDLISDSSIDGDLGSSFFEDFEDNDFGLSDIITLPLTTIQSLTSKTCTPLQIPVPFTNQNINLPCMTTIYQQKLPSIYNLWKIVSFGIVSYYICINIFALVKGFKDPDNDKVEVMDL